MRYKQSNYNIILNYINDEFEYLTEFLCGERVQFSNKNNQIITSENCKFNGDWLQIKWTHYDFDEFKIFFKKMFLQLKTMKIKLSAYLKLHKELVCIDNKKNFREYGFIKIMLTTDKKEYSNEFPIIYNFSDDLKNQILEYIEYIKKIDYLSARPSKKLIKNKYPIIFSPQASGCFIHEIIGHLLEEDFFEFYRNLFNKFRISKKLVIYDDIKGFETLIGLNEIDDDGTKIKPLKLLSDGKINNIMAINKYKSFDKKLYGFSRRENFKNCSFARMRCTSIKPGNDGDLNSIIKKTNNAIFMYKVNRAYVTPGLDNYTLIGDGFEIKNGIVGNFINKLMINGNIVDDLKHVKYIGSDSKIFVSYCNKLNQLTRVGVYTPTISLSEVFSIEGDLHG